MRITEGETQFNASLILKFSVTVTMKKMFVVYKDTVYDIVLCQPRQPGQYTIYKRQSSNLVARKQPNLNMRAYIQMHDTHIRIQAWLWTYNPSAKEAGKGRSPGVCWQLEIGEL